MSQEQSKNQRHLVAFVNGQKVKIALPYSGELSLGRASSNDVRLKHPSVSRAHLRLHCSPQSVEAEDLGSRFGTRVFSGGTSGNPESGGDETHGSSADWKLTPNERRELKAGDMMRVGSVMIRVEADDPSLQSPAPHGDAQVVEEDPATLKVHELARRVARGNIPVLILGETGVGKDVIAQMIHRASGRAEGPFVRIHCAALSENLLESELFGHVKGAFTGAGGQKEGLIESAHGGTVFLDELGEMPLQTQVKLLNVLETSEVQRIGATRPRKVDVRFIGATNRDLPAWVEEGRFRRDLYFRINGITLNVPPLRERAADIVPLACHFLSEACARDGRPVPKMSESCRETLMSAPWSGNLRELKNVMERAAILHAGSELQADDIEIATPAMKFLHEEDFDEQTSINPTISAPTRSQTASRRVARTKSRERVIQALEACSGNQTRAAESLGISRRTLINWLDEFGLPRPRKTN